MSNTQSNELRGADIAARAALGTLSMRRAAPGALSTRRAAPGALSTRRAAPGALSVWRAAAALACGALLALAQDACTYVRFGSVAGSAQRLVETHLAPGVADWNIVVPMPPPCKEAQVTGVDMRVCDTDVAPDVSMSDALTARVHRAGQLATFATVNVTVYCILPASTPPPDTPDTLDTPDTPAPAPPPTPPPPTTATPPSTPPSPPLPPSPPPTTSTSTPMPYQTDARSTYEMMSNEQISNESTFNGDSYESVSSDLTSVEPVTTVKPTTTTTLPNNQEETTTPVKLTSTTEVVTPPPHKIVHPKENPQHSLKVTINIAPTNKESSEEDVSQSYEPSSSSKEDSSEAAGAHNLGLSSRPHLETPPRFAEARPRAHLRPPHGPGVLPQRQRARVRPPLLPPGTQYPAMPPGTQYAAMPAPYGMMPAPYNLMPQQYPVAPAYRQVTLISPWLRFLQRRQPVFFYRHF